MITLEEKKELLTLLLIKDRLSMPEKMKAFQQPSRYKFAWGGRGAGKSQAIARILLHRANKKRIKILCTREIQNSIAESVHSLLSGLINELYIQGEYSITENRITNTRTGSEFIFSGLYQQDKKQSIKSMDSIDVAWVEEAQAVSKKSLDILIPTIRTPGSELWFSYNRLFPDDPVHVLQNSIPEKLKIAVNINYIDNPYLSAELRTEAEISRESYENGLSEDYPHIWMGEPIGLSEMSIIKSRDIDAAMERKIQPEGAIEIGADIARYGKDRTVIVKRHGLKMLEMKVYNGLSTVEIAGEIRAIAGHDRTIPIKVDDTGVGGGVTDILIADGFNVRPINFGESASDRDRYPNCISEMWFNFRDALQGISIINNTELKGELISREYTIDNKGRRQVEPKDRYKKRYGKSPDLADAVLLAFYDSGCAQIF